MAHNIYYVPCFLCVGIHDWNVILGLFLGLSPAALVYCSVLLSAAEAMAENVDFVCFYLAAWLSSQRCGNGQRAAPRAVSYRLFNMNSVLHIA